ncbi:MAG: hypothetical protein M0O99_03110 [Desulfuromonas thiophila]|nr:hypothetical protein [Desulfuromonas thiophila]MDY0251348.1 conjugative transfer protein MobI(A/C) [Pseudomonas sp.]
MAEEKREQTPEEQMQQAVQQALEAIDQAQQALAVDTQSYVDWYWQESTKLQEHAAWSDRSRLGCRIRNIGSGMYVQWYIADRWAKTAKSQYIGKPAKSLKYSLTTLLRYAPAWQHKIVQDSEAVFAQKRHANQQLAQARVALRRLAPSESAGETDDGQ